MESQVIRLGIWPSERSTLVVAKGVGSKTILRAILPLQTSNHRAVAILLEALALWEGRPVRAVLVADAWSTTSSPTTLYRDTFALFSDPLGLFELEWISAAPARHHGNGRTTSSFAALERLVLRSAAR